MLTRGVLCPDLDGAVRHCKGDIDCVKTIAFRSKKAGIPDSCQLLLN